VKAWRILACAVAVVSSTALAAPDDAPPKVELPLGPYVRPGRPLDVRVIGGADRVRAPGTPWALPQGARGDEFILQLTEATVGVLSLEIDRGGRVERTSTAVETLPRDGKIGAFTSRSGNERSIFPNIDFVKDRMPTLPEGWLLLDLVYDVDLRPSAMPRFWRAEPIDPRARGFMDPLLLTPDPRLFAATAEAAVRAPALPAGPATALTLCAAAELALALLLALRRDGPWRRAAWLCAPAVVCVAYVVSGDRLPGALRADATTVFMPKYDRALVLVRVDARRTGEAVFDLPASATSAAVLRYAPDDSTVESVSAGRRVELIVPAGQSRLFAYSIDAEWPFPGSGDVSAPSPTVPNALHDWIADAGFERVEKPPSGYGAPSELLPTTRGTAVVAGLHAVADGLALTK
jgi:hypothetical protein